MEILIKNYLKEYFKLPESLIRPDAQLNILAILSLYFEEKHEHGIEPADIDPGKLSTEIGDLEMTEDGNKLEFDLKKLLKKPGSRKVLFTDHVGRDGFCEFHLHWFLAMMELPEKIGTEPINERLMDSCRKVEDLFKAYDFSYNFSSN